MAEHVPLVVIALELEGQGLFEQAEVSVLYTGLGKVNAALSLARRLSTLRAQGALPNLVVNFGTAGSRTFAHRQRDCLSKVRAARHGRHRSRLCARRNAVRDAAGDALVPGGVPSTCPRAFAAPEIASRPAQRGWPATSSTWKRTRLAKACLVEDVPFACAKYISDGADHTAADDWQASLPQAAAAFLALYQTLSRR